MPVAFQTPAMVSLPPGAPQQQDLPLREGNGPDWHHAIRERKEAKAQVELERQRQELAIREMRWEGVPAWKRAIIEKKEAALAAGEIPPPS